MSWKPKPIARVSPITAFSIDTAGQSRPIRMRCQNGTGTEDYIVKLWNQVPEKQHSLAREVYGTALANYFELDTPDIALVDIPEDFHLYETDQQRKLLLEASPGLNFGSNYLQGPLIFSPPAHYSIEALALRIFCFDMFIGNMDRCIPKINMFKSGKGLVLFDHEKAFPFSRKGLLLDAIPAGWKFIQEPWSKQHILYSSIKGKLLENEIDRFIADISKLKDEVFARIEAIIPNEWQADVDKITNYLVNTRDNATKFKLALQELLV